MTTTDKISPALVGRLRQMREALKRQNNLPVFFSLVASKTDVAPQAVQANWSYLKALLEKPQVRETKDGPGWIFAKFKNGGTRENVNVESVYGLVVDIDKQIEVIARHEQDGLGADPMIGKVEEETRLADEQDFSRWLNGYTHLIHTTWSHTREQPRYRIVIPFKRAATPDEYGKIFDFFHTLLQEGYLADGHGYKPNYVNGRWLEGWEGIYVRKDVVDKSSRPVSHFFYLPSCPKERLGEFKSIQAGRDVFNPDDFSHITEKFDEEQKKKRTAERIRNHLAKVERKERELNRTPKDVERVREALTFIPAEDREVWLKVGMALHYGGFPQRVWDEWSKTCSEKFSQRDQDYTWSHFHTDRQLTVSLGTIFHWAKEHGWEGDSGPEVIIKHGLLDWAKLATMKAPPIRYHIAHWLGPWPTLLAGKGGAGKTLLAQTLGTTLATGCDYIDRITEPTNVLLWACEDDHDELWRRQERICAHFKIDMADLNGKFFLEARRGMDNELFVMSRYGHMEFTGLLKELEEQIHDQHIGVVALDNIAQIFGGNENDRHQVTRFINGLLGTARGKEVAYIFLAHPAKAMGSEYAGSTAWENACRMRWYLGSTLPDEKGDGGEASVNDDLRYLCKRKTNYTVKDYRRFQFQNGVLVPEQIYLDTDGTAQIQEDARARYVVIEGFQRLKDRGLHPTDAQNSPYSLPKLLIDNGMADGLGKVALKRAVIRLMGEGAFKRGKVSTYANGSPREGLIWVGP